MTYETSQNRKTWQPKNNKGQDYDSITDILHHNLCYLYCKQKNGYQPRLVKVIIEPVAIFHIWGIELEIERAHDALQLSVQAHDISYR